MGLTPAILDDALILRGKPAIQVGHDPRPTGVNDQMPKTWQSLRINKLTRADPEVRAHAVLAGAKTNRANGNALQDNADSLE